MAGVTRITERVKLKYKSKASKERAEEYIYSPEADKILAPVISDYAIKDVDKLKKEILERIKF